MKIWGFLLVLFISVGAFAQEMDTTYAMDQNGEIYALVYDKGNEPIIPEGLYLIDVRFGNEDKIVSPEIIPEAKEVDSLTYYQDLVDQNSEKALRYNKTGNILLASSGIALVLSSIMIIDAGSAPGAPGILELIGGLCIGSTILPLGVTGLVFKIMGNSNGFEASTYQDKLDSYKQKNSVVKLDIVPVVNPVNRTIGGNFALVF